MNPIIAYFKPYFSQPLSILIFLFFIIFVWILMILLGQRRQTYKYILDAKRYELLSELLYHIYEIIELLNHVVHNRQIMNLSTGSPQEHALDYYWRSMTEREKDLRLLDMKIRLICDRNTCRKLGKIHRSLNEAKSMLGSVAQQTDAINQQLLKTLLKAKKEADRLTDDSRKNLFNRNIDSFPTSYKRLKLPIKFQ